MSDQRRAGDVISLEEIFGSRDFGRRPTRWDSAPVATVEPADPPHLEQLFLSDLFGHPEAIAAALPSRVTPVITAPVAPPILVVLSGRGGAERDYTRSRGAIGAVSGVAAAALVVAGMASGTGTGSPSGQPTVSAEGKHPGHISPAGHAGSLPAPSGVATQPNISDATTGQPPAGTGGSATAAPIAQLASATTPVTAAVVVAVPPPPTSTPVEAAPSPPAPGGGTTPSGTSPGGGGSVLTPVFVTVGTTVSTVGSTVTAASNGLSQAVPAASPVTGLLGAVGTTVTNLGSSVAGS
jgi:hypothetical protein